MKDQFPWKLLSISTFMKALAIPVWKMDFAEVLAPATRTYSPRRREDQRALAGGVVRASSVWR